MLEVQDENRIVCLIQQLGLLAHFVLGLQALNNQSGLVDDRFHQMLVAQDFFLFQRHCNAAIHLVLPAKSHHVETADSQEAFYALTHYLRNFVIGDGIQAFIDPNQLAAHESAPLHIRHIATA